MNERRCAVYTLEGDRCQRATDHPGGHEFGPDPYDVLRTAARAVVAQWDRWEDAPWNPNEPHWADFNATVDALRAAVEESLE